MNDSGSSRTLSATAQVASSCDIAVIGMAVRFPGGAGDADELWRFLLERGCAIREIPSDRWSIPAFHDENPNTIGKGRSRWGGFVDDPYAFDPGFFDISPREAFGMDPQQRMLLEVTYEALQDAGLSVAAASRAETGVFIGISSSDFASIQRAQPGLNDVFGGTGSALSIAANRISHRFNLSGPSFVVDTACSSALVALDEACRSIASGACGMAVVGGANCLLHPAAFIAFAKANMLSPTGAIYAFDRRADGFIRGEGCGIVVLKPLGAAIAAKHRIHAVIRATAVTQDGRTATLTAPNGHAQRRMLENAVACAGIVPGDVGYVEAHGTGTPAGDPIEAHAIGHVFGRQRTEGPLLFGSIKPNIGHLESAAGIAGFIKAVLSVRHGMVAPNINFETANPAIPMEALNIAVPTACMPLPDRHGRRFAAVNSFGFGGTNACAIVQNHTISTETERAGVATAISIRTDVRPAPRNRPILLPLSSPTKEGLAAWAERLAESVAGAPSDAFPAMAADLAMLRDHFLERAVVLGADNAADFVAALRALARGETKEVGAAQIITGRAREGRKVAFTFSGQGAQWWAMGRRLIETEIVVRNKIAEFDSHFEPLAGWSVFPALLADESESKIDRSDVTQAGLVALHVALAALWHDRGLIPELVLGHSLGEISAACVAGAITLETAARIIHRRGLIRLQSPEPGAMAAVGLTKDEVVPFLPEDDSVLIGAVNGPAMTTLTGREAALQRSLAGIAGTYPHAFVRRLNTDFAWHSALLDYGEAWFRSGLRDIAWDAPRIPFLSTSRPGLQNVFDLDFWWQNLRRPVLYQQAVELCLDLGIDAFLEIGPQRTLTPLNVGILQNHGRPGIATHSLARGEDDCLSIGRAAATLHVNGVALDWNRLNSASRACRVPLPLYPWRHERFHHMPIESRHALLQPPAHPLLGRSVFGPLPAWTNEIDAASFGYLKDHRILDQCVLPAAAFAEIMAAAVRAHSGPGLIELRSVRFLEALSLGDAATVILRTELDPALGKIMVYSRGRDSEADWRLHADGYGLLRELPATPPEVAAAAPAAPPDLDQSGFYRLMRRHGYDFGPAFQRVHALWIENDQTSIASIQALPAVEPAEQGYLLHPSQLDAAFQATVALHDFHRDAWKPGDAVADEVQSNGFDWPMHIPVEIKKLLIFEPGPATMVARYRVPVRGKAGIHHLLTQDGRLVAIIEGVETKVLKRAHEAVAGQGPELAYYRESFYPKDRPTLAEVAADARARRWMFVAAREHDLRALGDALTEPGGAAEFMMPSDIQSGALAGRLLSSSEEAASVKAIVFAAFAAQRNESCDNDDLAGIVEDRVHELISLAAICKSIDASRRPALFVLTKKARFMASDAPMTVAGLSQMPLVACLRTIRNELQGTPVYAVDLDDAALVNATELADLLRADWPETECVLRGDTCYVPRFEAIPAERLPAVRRTVVSQLDPANYAIAMTEPGSVENVVLRLAATPDPEPDELVVEVAAAGLNFRDILAASSLLPGELESEDAWWRNLGFEFAGTVTRVGSGVVRFRAGDRVMGIGRNLLRRYARVNERVIASIPGGLDFVSAASLPTAFLTAEYALEHVARLSQGERVLIHLASGGVGLAAIQVARRCGAEIFATAGTEAKRTVLRDLGIRHVMDSRSLDFAEEVLAATGGAGVDVILNALPGSAIAKNLECLAPFGRFIEIGKRDLLADTPIGLRALHRNNTFAVVDIAALASERPEILSRCLEGILQRFREGVYRPLPVTAFPASQGAAAMRFLARAQHVGKVAIEFSEPEVSAAADLAARTGLRPDASYLITGGLKGFGLATAQWASRNGAGRLILASRSGEISEDAAACLAALRAQGTEIVPVALDVTDSGSVEHQIAELVKCDKPLAGIVHAAAVIADGFVEQLDRARIGAVIRPKVAGAWNLHRAVEKAGTALDFFVCYSSIAECVGAVGQANYVAANAFLDGLAEFRRSHGGVGLSIAWGALGESGFVARSGAHQGYFSSFGIRPMSDAEALDALDRLLKVDCAAVACAAIDWVRATRTLLNVPSPRLQPVLIDRRRSPGTLVAQFALAAAGNRERIVAEAIRSEVARVLKVEAEKIDFERRLIELGLDSLSSFELKNRIESLADLTIPVAKFLQSPTISALAKMLTGMIEASLKGRETGLQGSSANDAPSQTARDGRPPLKTLPRQALMLRLANLPLASDVVRVALIISRSVTLPEPVDRDRLAAAIAEIATRHEALRLRAAESAQEGWQLDLEGAPRLICAASADEALALMSERRDLWTVAILPAADAGSRILVSAHRAAADHISLALLLKELLAAYAGHQPGIPASGWTAFASRQPIDEDDPVFVSHRAHWAEMLSRVLPPVVMSERRRASLPTRLGIDRGALGVFEVGLTGMQNASTAIERESVYLAAFCKALGREFGRDQVVVERHDPSRADAGAEDLIGTVSGAFPVVVEHVREELADVVSRTRAALHLARKYRAFDTATIEHVLGNELEQRSVALRQFGFSMVPDGDIPAHCEIAIGPALDDLALEPWNELRLNVAVCPTVRAQFVFDSDVITRERVEKLARRVLEALNEGAEVGTSTLDVHWKSQSSAHKLHRAGDAEPASGGLVVVPAARTQSAILGTAPRTTTLPVSMQQNFLLSALQDKRVTDAFRQFWIVDRAYRVSPALDLARLKVALAALVTRHESLRTRFSLAGGTFGAVIEERCEPPLAVEDLGDVTTPSLLGRIEALSAAPLDPLAQRPFSLTLLRCGARGDVLHCKGHHSIVDGWSMSLLVEELLSAYLGLPLAPVALSVGSYLEMCDRSGDPSTLKARYDYFRALLQNAPPVPRLGRVTRRLRPNFDMVEAGPGRELLVNLPRDVVSRKITDRARRAGASATALLIAATAQTISQFAEGRDVIVCVPAAMRTDRRLQNYVGWVSSLMPVRCRTSQFASLDALARDIFEQYQASMAYLPADSLVRCGQLHDELTAEGSYLTLFEVGMQAVEVLYRDRSSAALHQPAGSEELSFGPVKVKKIGKRGVQSETVYLLDVRSFEADGAHAYRCGFDLTDFDTLEAGDRFAEILDRLGLSEGQVELTDPTGALDAHIAAGL